MPNKASEFAISFPLDLGMDDASAESAVQPTGQAAALVLSRDTRLSKLRGAPSKSPNTEPLTDGNTHPGAAACGGIIPCGNMSSSLVMRQRLYRPQRIAGDEMYGLAAVLGAGPLGSFWSADVPRAGTVPASSYARAPAVVLHQGQLWFASVRQNGPEVWVFLSVLGPDGECLASPYPVVPLPPGVTVVEPPWIGLTAHGVNGVRLWYRFNNEVRLRTVTLAPSGLVNAGAATTIYTPVAAGVRTYDVCAHGTQFAWVVTPGATLVTDVALTKVNVGTNAAVSTVIEPAAVATNSRLAVSSAALRVGNRVAVAVAIAGGVTEILYDGDANTRSFKNTTPITISPAEPACGFYRSDFLELVCFGATAIDASIGVTFPAAGGSVIEIRNFSGPLHGRLDLPWVGFLSNFGHHSPGPDELYPVFLAQPGWAWNGAGSIPTNREYTSDPAVHLYRIDSVTNFSCIGRFGVDTAAVHPPTLITGAANIYNSRSLWVEGDSIAFVYAERAKRIGDSPFPARYVEVSMAARQPRFAIGADGPALIAGAMPAEWDGVTVAEVNPPHRPNIAVNTAGGSGPSIPAGTYLVAAIVKWRDAAAVEHRSFPTRIETVVTSTAGAWKIQVSAHPLVRDGLSQDPYEYEVYMSVASGTVLYQQGMAVTSKTTLYVEFANVPTPIINDNTPIIYTTGEPGFELPAQHPPALYDVAIVVDRAWGLNAERRNEYWYTKAKQTGVAYEWSSEQTVIMPQAAGKGVGVVENSGTTTFLCENGVWVATGAGPDASLSLGTEYNAPEQVADIGCTSRESILRTPAGVMFQSHGKFALIGPGGQRLFDQIDVSNVKVVGAVLLRDTQEAVFFTSTSQHYVYNYALDRWSVWSPGTIAPLTAVSRDPVSGLVNGVQVSDQGVVQLDPASVSEVAQLYFETGHMNFGGPEDDNVVNEVVLRAESLGPHGATLTIANDYGQGPGSPFTKTFSAADIAACVVSGQYTLSASPGSMSLRALKVTVAETGATGAAMRPLSLTVQGAKNGGTKRDAVYAAGRK